MISLKKSSPSSIKDLYTAEERTTSRAYNEALRRGQYQQGVNVRLAGPGGSPMTWSLADPVASAGWGSSQIALVRRLTPRQLLGPLAMVRRWMMRVGDRELPDVAQPAGIPASFEQRSQAGCSAVRMQRDLHCRSSVIRGVAELERDGHLSVTRLKLGKKNVSNRYRLPPMQGSTETPPSSTQTPGGSVCVEPEPVRTLEPVKKAALLSVPKNRTTGAKRKAIIPRWDDWPIYQKRFN